MIKVAIIGYGYWGPNLFRNFLLAREVVISHVCELDSQRLTGLAKLHPNIKLTANYLDVLDDPTVDAVIIATSPSTHFNLAFLALKAGKDVLVEKPMTTSSQEAESLIALAKQKKRVLMVDHTFIYSQPVEAIKKIILSGKMGRIVNVDSVRINLGLYQRDINVIQDLAVHDFTIFDYLFGFLPKSIAAIGAKHFDLNQEDQAYLHLWYPNNMLASINVSWLSPIKVRRMIICGTNQMLIYDDMEITEKIKLFDTGIKIERDPKEILKMKVGYRQGDIFSPNIDTKEPLTSVAEDFIYSIKTRNSPRADGQTGLRVVKILESAMHSLKAGGKIASL